MSRNLITSQGLSSVQPVGGFGRRGNVMLFVIFILGTLFAASVAFLALMRTDTEIVAAERQESRIEIVVDGVIEEILLSSASSVIGQGNVGGKLVAAPYLQIVDDNDGPDGVPASAGSTDDDGIADNADSLSRYAINAIIDPMISSIEADVVTGGTVLEYPGAVNLDRAWDGRADVRMLAGALEPTVPASHPLRIRPLPGGGLPPPFNYPYDQSDDSSTHHAGLCDADGDGVADSMRYRLLLLGGGEADWGPAGYFLGDTDDFDCDGAIDAAIFTGAPSFTINDPLFATPLPCDDAFGSVPGTLESGTAYPQNIRRAIAAALRDDDPDVDDEFDDLYFSLRQFLTGGLVNINSSHRSLVDNLFGLNGQPTSEPTAWRMDLPYGVSSERILRHRGMLPPNNLKSKATGLTDDLLADIQQSGAQPSPLYETIFGAMFDSGAGSALQWVPLTDQPGDGATYDLDWSSRWTNPFRWNDMSNSGVGGGINYDIHRLLTTISTDDLFMRNGLYGGGLLANGLPAYNPASDFLPVAYQASTDSAIQMYGYDPSFVAGTTPAFDFGDRSFYLIDRTTSPPTMSPKVPAMLSSVGTGALYEARRDPSGNITDPRAGKLQFALHSIGDINNLTQREIQTVLDYFTVMLRNVKNPGSLFGGATNLDNAIHDQAAQLTANFIDFADFDGGPGTPTPGGMRDYPTEVKSRSGKVYYGFEHQPFISEVYSQDGNHAVELVNPYPVDLQLAGYSLRVVGPSGAEIIAPMSLITGGGNGILDANGFVHYFSGIDPQSGGGGILLPNLALNDQERVQLIRDVNIPGGLRQIVVDEFTYNAMGILSGNSLQRDTNSSGRWLAVVPQVAANPQGLPQTIGTPNTAVNLYTGGNVAGRVAPVHAMTDSNGLESAYPTTGSLLLIMRYAHRGTINPSPGFDPQARSMTSMLTTGGNPGNPLADAAAVDNGHMPVFDPNQVAQKDWLAGTLGAGAQPMDGTTLLNVPWGQLVFDYFTALPFDNDFDPMVSPPEYTIPTNSLDAGDPDWPANPNGDGDGDGFLARNDRGYAEYLNYLRSNQPAVDLGYRVHGRINIGAAPWKVLQGLPLMPPGVMPIYKRFDPALVRFLSPGTLATWAWGNMLNPGGLASAGHMGEVSFTPDTAGGSMEQLGSGKAQGIVAYRELREIVSSNAAGTPQTTGDYNVLNGGSRLRQDGSGGMLANVTQRHTAGFLTVGELANVRIPRTAGPFVTGSSSQMDNGQSHVFTGAKNYLFAVAPMVALGDWVTVKGHTFAAYGVLTGQGKVENVNKVAERFEMVYDRSNVLISNDPAERPVVIYKVREPLSELNPN